MSYTVHFKNGVTLVYASNGISISDFAKLSKMGSKDAVLDIALQNRVGAVMAFGDKKALRDFRESGRVACDKVLRQISDARSTLKNSAATQQEIDEVAGYLDGYDRGQSADALLRATTLLEVASDTFAYPHVADDMGRCVRLYKSSSLVRSNFQRIASLNSDWALITEHWHQHLVEHESVKSKPV